MNQAPSPRLLHGVDLVEVARFRESLARAEAFEARVFTEGERAYCRGRADPAIHLAARFAAKEAVLKALGLTVSAVGVDAVWQEVEVVRDAGPPKLALAGRAAQAARRAGVSATSLSLSHTEEHAMASVVMLAGPREGTSTGGREG